ncbi:MAG: hypothetical protein P8R04_04330, partial [Gammaproteobacteria bacterium]|nr:hypothetical protein [Gammaproteobacteria bacterium]
MNNSMLKQVLMKSVLSGPSLFIVMGLLSLFGCERQITAAESEISFKRIPLQFIAALGDPNANSGTGAESWAVWPVDPGPRGVRISSFDSFQDAGGVAPAGWRF